MIELRRATLEDVDFLVELFAHEDVEPFLSVAAARDRDSVLADVGRSLAEPEELGRFVIEVDGRRAGTVSFEIANRRSKIAQLQRLAIHPDFRGRGVADEAAGVFQRHLIFELGFHRLQLEVYGYNERAIRHAERAGFIREGTKRKAYWRNGEWQDGVMFGLVREDLEAENP